MFMEGSLVVFDLLCFSITDSSGDFLSDQILPETSQISVRHKVLGDSLIQSPSVQAEEMFLSASTFPKAVGIPRSILL